MRTLPSEPSPELSQILNGPRGISPLWLDPRTGSSVFDPPSMTIWADAPSQSVSRRCADHSPARVAELPSESCYHLTVTSRSFAPSFHSSSSLSSLSFRLRRSRWHRRILPPVALTVMTPILRPAITVVNGSTPLKRRLADPTRGRVALGRALRPTIRSSKAVAPAPTSTLPPTATRQLPHLPTEEEARTRSIRRALLAKPS